MYRFALVLLSLLASGVGCVQARAPDPGVDEWNREFDQHFRKYSKRYFGPNIDWRWFKSQAIAESGLDPEARSSVGAKGLMQIMPSTFEEIRASNRHFQHIDQPRWNIAAGIYYDRQIYRKWKTPPPGDQRLLFTFGSYNAGYGRVNKALRKAGESARFWTDVKGLVPGQTRHYVFRIQDLMGRPVPRARTGE